MTTRWGRETAQMSMTSKLTCRSSTAKVPGRPRAKTGSSEHGCTSSHRRSGRSDRRRDCYLTLTHTDARSILKGDFETLYSEAEEGSPKVSRVEPSRVGSSRVEPGSSHGPSRPHGARRRAGSEDTGGATVS